MALEPTSVQRDKMLSHGKIRLSLVQFLVMKDVKDPREYFRGTAAAVQNEKGIREHQLRIDQVITRGEMPYQCLMVDNFPSSQALLMAHENSRNLRNEYLSEVYSLIVQAKPNLKKVGRTLGFTSSWLTKLLKTAEVKGIDHLKELGDHLDPETDPDAGKVLEFSNEKLDQPFYMMNLNQFSRSPRRGEGGKSAYNQYTVRIMPRLISVGGYPDIYGKILSTYIGDQKSALFNSWHDFALVYYPSRTSFLRLMTNTPQGAAEIRREGLKKVVLMASSNLQPQLDRIRAF
jgi:hypothetical protein